MKRNSKNTPVKTYTMMTIGYPGATPQPSFTFTAKDEKDADNKAYGWRRYQGFVNTTNVDAKNEAIASAIGFLYLPMVGQFYNTVNQATSDFNVGYLAYYAGFQFNDMTSNEMALGWEDGHGERMYAAGMMDSRNEPGYRTSWETF